MGNKKSIAIVGGDLRQAHLANSLAAREDGFNIYGLLLDKDVKLSGKIIRSDNIGQVLPGIGVIIFPLPLLSDSGGINAPPGFQKITPDECLEYISPDTLVLAGKVPEKIHNKAAERGVIFNDYFEREEFSVLNAVPTAEGAVEIAMREMSVTLFGATCVVVGYGRISKVLVRLLAAFGAKVKVVARQYSDLAWIRANGQESVHLSQMSAHLPMADLLINTVPAMLLDEDKLSLLKRNCFVIDLASKPGGIDFEAAKSLGLKAIWALSLPGKVAPITAGEFALDTIINILREKGVL